MNHVQKAIKDGVIDLQFTQIPCAVLKDGTRLITTKGVQKALGKSNPGGGRSIVSDKIPSFLNVNALKPFVDSDLTSSLTPIEFQMTNGGKAFGYKAETLPKICEVFLRARDFGVLTEKQLKHAATADLIVRSLAKVGIIALVDEATGWQEFRDKTALQALLDKYLSAEAAKWAKTFPDSFYLGLFRLRNWDVSKDLKKKPSVVAHYTKDLVYNRLAPGLMDSLEEKNPVQESGRRKNCHHQFLSKEQGLTHLKGHLFMVQKIMKMSKNWEDFMGKMDSLLPISTTEDIDINLPK